MLFTPVWARIGETPEECDARYGKQQKSPFDYTKDAFGKELTKDELDNRTRTYENKELNLKIKCEFKNKKCISISFSRSVSMTGRSLISDNEIKLFLDKNSKNKNFSLMGREDGVNVYIEPESGRKAFMRVVDTAKPDYYYPYGVLKILGDELSAEINEKVKAKDESLERL
jgi:hypothetical protein